MDLDASASNLSITMNVLASTTKTALDIKGSAGGNDTLNVALSGAEAITNGFKVDSAVETFNLTITDNNHALDLTNVLTTTTLKTASSGNPRVVTIDNATKNIDASNFNANETLVVNATSSAVNITGGSSVTDKIVLNSAMDDFNVIGSIEIIDVDETYNLSGKVNSDVRNINVANGKNLTLGSLDLSGNTIKLDTSNVITINATAENNEQNFANITQTGTGIVVLKVASTLNVQGQNISVVDKFDVSNTKILTIDSAQLEVRSTTATGIFDVKNLQDTLSANFSNVNAGATLNVEWQDDTATYTGNLTNVDTLVISSGTMSVTDNILGLISVSGAGNIVVMVDTDSSQDFANLSLTGTETIIFSANSIFSGNFRDSNITVDNGVTLTTDVARVSGLTIGGTGTVELSDVLINAGEFTATITTGAVSATLAAITNVDANDVITFTTNDTTVDASDLVDLDAKVDTSDYSSVTGITEAFETPSLTTEITNALALLDGNETITITGGAISATDTNTIADLTTGVLSASVTADSAANLVAALTNANSSDALTLTLTDVATDAADLITLNTKTSVAINASAITSTINGDASELIDVYVTNIADYTGLGNEPIIVDDTTSATNVNTIANATSGAVTATITTGAVSATLAAIANVDANDVITFTTNVTATITTGAVSATLAAITNVDANDVITFTTNDTSADATDIVALNAKVDTFGVDTITTVTELAANIGANAVNVTDAIAIVGNTHAVTITNAISATDANFILNESANGTSGVVTATITSDTAANLNTNLANAVGTDALTLTVNDTSALATDLNALDEKTSVNINAASLDTITGSAGDDVINLGSMNIIFDTTLTVNSGTGKDTLTGTAGNETFKFTSADFDSNDTINGGDGTADCIVFSDAMSKDYESDFVNVSNVENFVGSSSADSFTLDFSSITTMQTNGEKFDALDGNDTVSIEATLLNLASDTSLTQSVFDNIETID
ncbi:MAG: hypothetical protein IE883_07770, partial [Epsilonproteobacteria bacterium]|nr:hypothetical protein [Campylobacterota bacterium]